jgi:S1-C subfamily serine protease
MDYKMDEITLLEAAERYHKGEMTEQEKLYFEELRKNNQEVDQLMVEHSYFLNEVENFSQSKNFKHSLHEVENKLIETGIIKKPIVKGGAKLVYLWKKHKRTVAVAASIAGMISILTAGLTLAYNNKSNPEIDKLSRELLKIKEGQTETSKKLKDVENKIDPKATPKSGGTGFLIDGQGYLITNSHVLKGKTIIATNDKGKQFLATICMQDNNRDIAVLKIADKDFIPFKTLPYSINKAVNLAEPIYTMGYPKDEIVYGEGYLSSETGYKSDTLSYQIAIAAEHGNSGGPVLNKNGDVIGILTDKSEGGAVFAVKSLYIFKTVESLKKDSVFSNNTNTIKNLDRVQQVKKVNSCVFLIKSYD